MDQVHHDRDHMTGQRSLVVDDEIRVRATLRRGGGEQQVEDTPIDPERLDVGEITESDVFEPFEPCQTLHRAREAAPQRPPGMRVEYPCAPTTMMASTVGLVLIEVYAAASGVQCGRARTVTVAAYYDYGALDIVIDDGRGLPHEFGASAFDRFVMVQTRAIPGGVVRPQVEISFPTAELERSRPDGVRLPADGRHMTTLAPAVGCRHSPTSFLRPSCTPRITLDITAGEPPV
ncbi:hypothetical protein [Nocardia testacea]|uniref:hypothetical protein n=1 Tax=Nocardia testacea TaxID=248551 RepID=UPI003A8B7CFA